MLISKGFELLLADRKVSGYTAKTLALDGWVTVGQFRGNDRRGV